MLSQKKKKQMKKLKKSCRSGRSSRFVVKLSDLIDACDLLADVFMSLISHRDGVD